MNNTIVDIFNNLGAGTFILIMIFLGGVVSSVGFTLYKGYKAIETRVRKNTTDEIEDDKQMTEIRDSITGINNQISTLTEGVSKLTQNQEEFILQLHNVESKLDEKSIAADLSDEALRNRIDSISAKLGQINEKQTMLIESDKINIRSKITEVYYTAMENEFIDPHTLQNLEEQYKKYLEENGNAFAGELMTELRKLPHTKPKEG